MIQAHIVHELAVCHLDGGKLKTEELHHEGEQLMEALLDLEKCDSDLADSAVSSEADRGIVIAELLVTADSESEALEKFQVAVRSAIHAIGGWTVGWDDRDAASAEYRPQRFLLELEHA